MCRVLPSREQEALVDTANSVQASEPASHVKSA